MIRDIDIKEEIEKSYLEYALSVIIGRSIPNVRDGLKPVHRRILFTMQELHNYYNQPFKKSARIVGDVIGKYHPHSDGAIYESLIHMAQDFNMGYTLIDGQGNMGSVDGDKPAAMRYTECRMTRLAGEFLQDLDKGTVTYKANYDNTTVEPEILPTRIPNLLLNGTSGIAVGMATSIPPHNLGELIDGIIKTIDNPNITIKKLHQIVQGPDFPTGGTIYNTDDLLAAYTTGKGSVKIRGRVIIEPRLNGLKSIVITEIPYATNKTTLLEKIGKFVTEKSVTNITELRDESDRNGIRIVLDLKRNSQEEVIIQNLYKHTPLESTFSINMLSVVNNRPKIITLKEYFELFIQHRQEIILLRSTFEIDKLKKRVHILEGIKIALNDLDNIIGIIRRSNNGLEASHNLQTTFNLTEEQAKAILSLTLQRLTNLEQSKVEQEHKDSIINIDTLQAIINNQDLLNNTIKEELKDIKGRFTLPRRTSIIKEELKEVTLDDLITDERLMVTLTAKGYIKATPLAEYPSQKRGGKGIVHGSDLIKVMIITTAKQELLIFTNKGRYFIVKVNDIPLLSRRAKGTHISNIIDLYKDKGHPFYKTEEYITSLTSYYNNGEDNESLFFITKKGIIKRSPLSLFRTKKNIQGLPGITLKEGDQLLQVVKVLDSTNIMLISKMGMSLTLNCGSIRISSTTRAAIGVIGMSLRDDEIVSCIKIKNTDDFSILSISRNGHGRRSDINQFKVANRGSLGLAILKVKDKKDCIAGAVGVNKESTVVILTSNNTAISIKAKDVMIHHRYSLGGKVIKIEDNDYVTLIDSTDDI